MRIPAGYSVCRECGKLVKMYGIFAGWHLCTAEEPK